MLLKDLIERLQDCLDSLPEDLQDQAEVRLMTQFNYPFEYSVDGVCPAEEIGPEIDVDSDEEDGDEEGFDPAGETPAELVFYICEGDQLGYGTKAAWDAC
jgi:hypothetical protein